MQITIHRPRNHQHIIAVSQFGIIPAKDSLPGDSDHKGSLFSPLTTTVTTMLVSNFILTLTSLASIAQSAPFVPQTGKLQQQRRRAVDYPIRKSQIPRSEDDIINARALGKRSLDYSVVPVNGAAASSSAVTITETVQGTPVLKTILTIQPAITVIPSPAVKTVVYTSVVTENGPEETILVTTTQAIHEPAPATPAAVTTTATPSILSTSTKYYDNGMWHTLYPVKSWVPSSTLTPAPYPTDTTFVARAQGTGGPAAAYATGAYPKLRRRAIGTGGVAAAYPTGTYPKMHRRTSSSNAVIANAPSWNLTRTEFDGLRRFAN